jgi:uncharacterized membrane protein YeaQ/YmgE (transglycosylase-associated protein family)
MMIVLWVLAGLGVGWGAGRLLALAPGGVWGDLLTGVIGSVSAGLALEAAPSGGSDDPLTAVLGGVVGALAATLLRRAFIGRYRHTTV